MFHLSTLHRLARLSSVSTLLLGLTACSLVATAQSPAPRIRGPIEATPSIPLEGSLDPHVRLADDLGPLAPDTSIRGITLVFNRTPAQQADLNQLLAQQADPASPLYHHWLTPDDFAARFGISDSDLTATQTWLQSHGFTLDNLTRSRDRITFSGTAAQIQQAFGAQLHQYRTTADNALHFAPAAELSLPPALATVTAAVLHLSDFRPHPSSRTVRPDFTTLSSQSHFLAPKDIAIMYDLQPLGNYLGSGQSIAVVGQSYVPTASGSAVANFQQLLASPLTSISPVFVPGSGNEAAFPGDEAEADIDLEYTSGIAQSSSIFYVFTGSNSNYNVFDALVFAITQDIAPIISVSYGACEPLLSTSNLQQFNSLFQQAAAQGQTIVAASGDNGPTACAAYTSSQGVSLSQQQALAVGFPASNPYVTAVGGTQMAPGTFAAGTSQYWASAVATDNTGSLTGYVPEVAWNEDSSTIGIAASGGGASSFFTRPSWQTGVPGIPSGSYRLVPDIALQASITSPGYILCTDDQSFTGASSDCATGSAKDSNGQYILAGGTSFAAPIFAGFLAILNQYEHTSGLGPINPTLYGLAAQPSIYVSAFHDITSGTTACIAGDGNCGTPGQNVYAATAGYDQATGLGSLDFNQLATAWPVATPPGLIQTSTTFLSAPTSTSAGAPLPIQIIVNTLGNSTTMPTGSLSLFLDGTIVNPSLPIAGFFYNNQAGASYTLTAPSQTGSHIVIARYTGDSTHLPSSATYAFSVGNLTATGGITLSARDMTLATNGTSSTSITITPNGGYNGELTWSITASGGNGTQSLCYTVKAPTVSGPTTGTLYMGSGTSCNSPLPTSSQAHSNTLRSSAHPPAPHSRKGPAAATFLAVLLCSTLPTRRRKLLPILSLALLPILATTLTGCGGGSSIATANANTIGAQVYTITLTAKDSVNTSISNATTFTLTLTPN